MRVTVLVENSMLNPKLGYEHGLSLYIETPHHRILFDAGDSNLFEKNARILGGAVIGGHSAGELTNVIGFIIQGGMTITDLLVAQIGTQPMLTASPAAYPLIKAAEACVKLL